MTWPEGCHQRRVALVPLNRQVHRVSKVECNHPVIREVLVHNLTHGCLLFVEGLRCKIEDNVEHGGLKGQWKIREISPYSSHHITSAHLRRPPQLINSPQPPLTSVHLSTSQLRSIQHSSQLDSGCGEPGSRGQPTDDRAWGRQGSGCKHHQIGVDQ